jgi:predicted outer membrane repeat protein
VIDNNAPLNAGNNLNYIVTGISGTNHSFKVRAIKNNLAGNYSGTYPVVLLNPPVIFVKASATGSNNGLNWENAYTSLQTALTSAVSGQEIWVAAGTYKPTTDTDRTKTFQLKDGVNIYGGFAGGESLRADRNFNTNVVILSGDLNGNDIDGNLTTNKTDNSYNVLVGVTGATIDGFSIKYGNASGNGGNNYFDFGGGMFNKESSPIVSNVIFSNNSGYYGGGMANEHSSPTVSNVTFTNNSANWGGGMLSFSGSPTITNVTFTNNSATVGGGMNINYNSSPTITNSTFSNNTGSEGGAVFMNNYATPTITNVTFSNNSANSGGGIYNNSSSATITNSTLSGNSATIGQGGGIYNNFAVLTTINNSILWGNTAQTGANIQNVNSSTPNITYSDIQGGFSGTGNINSDPLFENASDPDGVDNIFRTGDDGLKLSGGSPAINTGTNSGASITDITGYTRPLGGTVDIGAYETRIYTDFSLIPSGPVALGQTLTVNSIPSFHYELFHTIVSSAFDFGDSSGSFTTNGAGQANHVYAAPGTFNIKLTVTDETGYSSVITKPVTVQAIPANVIVVKPGGSGNGTSWANAYGSLQSALAASSAGGKNEIWVAAGTYKPGTQRTDTFSLILGVSVYGGFNGTEVTRSQRNFVTNPTILSGDIDGQPDNYDENIANGISHTNVAGNSYHVVSGGSNATLDGFIIKGGNASNNGVPNQDRGGGLICSNPNLVLKNLVFIGNSAYFAGGGLYISDPNSSTLLDKVVFSGNVSGYGGAIHNFQGTLSITNAVFSNNQGGAFGGGIFNEGPLTVTNSTFSNNLPLTAGQSGGGGIWKNNAIPPVLNNILFWNSSADEYRPVDQTQALNVLSFGPGNVQSNVDVFVNSANPIGTDLKWFTNDDGLRISTGSSIINPLTFYNGFPLTDILNNSREAGPEPGAYEYLP